MSDINQKNLDGVGGRNLLLNSNQRLNKPVGTNYATIPNFTFKETGTYTIGFNAIVTTDENSFDSHLIYVGRTVGFSPRVENGRTYNTFEIKEQDLGKPIYLYMGSDAGDSKINGGYFEYLKLEKGNKATDWTPAPEDINFEKYVKNTRYGINKILAYYYPSVKGSEKDTYLFLNHLNNSIYTTNYKIALCLTLIENGKFNMTRFQELKSKIDHLSKYIYSLETLIRYTLENKIYIKD